MSRMPTTTAEWIDYYRQKEDEAFDRYQIDGLTRDRNASYKAGAAREAFEALAREKSEKDVERHKRFDNVNYMIDRLGKDTYTKDEVADLMRKAAGV